MSDLILSPDIITNAIFIVALVVIGFFLRADRQAIKDRIEKNEKWLVKQQHEITEISKHTYSAIELLKQNQDNDRENIKLFRELIVENRKVSNEILDKIRAITP